MKRILRFLFPREDEKPSRAYDRVIAEKKERTSRLAAAHARLVAVTKRIEGDLFERRAEVARHHADARRSAQRDDDRRALELLEQMGRAKEGVKALEEELADVRREAETVERDLAEIRTGVRELEREKAESLARLESAAAKRAVRALLGDGAHAEDDRRLEGVRSLVARTTAEAALDRELDRGSFEPIEDPTARIELARLKAKLAAERPERGAELCLKPA
jgi:phage shock protein A